MPDTQLLLRLILLLAASLVILVLVMRAKLHNAEELRVRRGRVLTSTPETRQFDRAISEAAPIPFQDPMIDTMAMDIYRRAFTTEHFNYSIVGEHRQVLDRVRAALPRATANRHYFPRKPLIMPRLLGALKNSNSSREDVVKIIIEDPTLAGGVLKLANSPLYRISSERIDTIGRAVSLLGIDGLRALVATSVMQPIFQVPRGYFEQFPVIVWNQAVRSALSAQHYARLLKDCDSFTAHLLAMLHHMSQIVLFRMTAEQYIDAAGSLPRAEVFTSALDEFTDEMARMISVDWELPESICAALEEYRARPTLHAMSPLARALYFGRICGSAALLAEQQATDDVEVINLFERKGLTPQSATALWQAARAEAA